MISFREYSENDVPLLTKNLNNPEVTKYLTSSIPQPYTQADAIWWVQQGSKEGIVKVVEYRNAFIGTVGVRPGMFEKSKSAEIGYWFSMDYWSKGLATMAVSAMTDSIFQTTDIVRLYAPVFSPNDASKKVLEKCGYHLESIQRKAAFKFDVFYDIHLYVKFC